MPIVTLPHDGGWDELLRRAPKAVLEAAFGAIAPGARMDIEPHIAAYRAAGMVWGDGPAKKKTSSSQPKPALGARPNKASGGPVHTALRAAMDELQPRIIPWKDVLQALRRLARELRASFADDRRHSILFCTFPGAKSNLWVFLMLMHEMRDACPNEWKVLRSRVWLAVHSQVSLAMHHTKRPGARKDFSKLPPQPRHVLLCDDCVYSGEQMGRFQNDLEALRPDRVTYAPVYTTVPGMQSAIQAFSQKLVTPVDVRVTGGVLGYSEHTTHDVGTNDCALCMRTSAGWLVLSLFHIMGLARQQFQTSTSSTRFPHDNVWFEGARLSAKCSLRGCMATAFQHKLADGVSLPWDWLANGPTLRAYMVKACLAAPCDLAQGVDILVAPLQDVLAGIDAKLEAEPDGTSARWPLHPKPNEWRALHNDGSLTCAERLLDVKSLLASSRTARLVRGVRIDTMPMFAPLLQPADACGKPRAEALGRADASSGAYWEKNEVEAASVKSRCVKSPYKEVLERVLSELATEPEGSAARALSRVMVDS